MSNIDFKEVAKSMGLPEFTTNQLIELIKIELLYVSYKKLDDNVVLKPLKIKKPVLPVEPFAPIMPEKPELNTLNGNSPEIEKINIDLYNEYKEAMKNYPSLIAEYEKEQKKYLKDHANYDSALRNYDESVKIFEKNEIKYKKELKKYERFEFQKKLNKKIENLYEKWTFKKWNNNVNSKLTYFMLMGPPGHGKTTVFRQAGKLVAKELGLIYKENPTVEDFVDINSFVLYVNNLAGEVSKTGTAGLPRKVQDEEGNEYTGLLPSYAMSALTKAGAGMLLLDDLANASSFIQNIALPLTNENSFNELKLDNVYIGITANLGAIDGTNTARMSSALRNRLKVAYTSDTVENFIYRTRTNENYFDDIGDFFVSDFLELNKDIDDYSNKMFYSMPDPSKLGGFSNPRSLDALIAELRRVVYDQGDLSEDENKKVIESISKSIVGNEIGADYYDYVDSIYTDAVPIIDKYFKGEDFDVRSFKEKLGDTVSSETKMFQFKFRKYLEKKIRSEAYKIEKIEDVKEKEFSTEKLFDKIAKIYHHLNDSMRASFSASLRENVFSGVPSFSMPHLISSSKEVLETEKAFNLIEKIKKIKNGNLDQEEYDIIKSIAVSDIVSKQEQEAPKRKRIKLS